MSDTPTPAELRDPGAHDRGGWLTLNEAAEKFRIPKERLAQAAEEGKLAVRKVGPVAPAMREAWLVQPDQVEQLLQQEHAPGKPGTS